jgi:hypothetical protein
VNFAEEKITQDLLNEAMPLLDAHWEECACWQSSIPLSVDNARYIKASESGLMRCYTMRKDGKLMGYSVQIAAPHLHYKADVFSANDVIFFDKSERQGMAAIRFMKYVEEQERARGVSVMTYHVKSFHDYPAIFERLGYKHIEQIYGKLIKE